MLNDERLIPVDFAKMPAPRQTTIDDWVNGVGDYPAPELEDAAFHSLLPAVVIASAIHELAGVIGYELSELLQCIQNLRE